jgi:hypothetical protein
MARTTRASAGRPANAAPVGFKQPRGTGFNRAKPNSYFKNGLEAKQPYLELSRAIAARGALPKKAKKPRAECPEGKVRDQTTKRCRAPKVAQNIITKKARKPKAGARKACGAGKVRNPDTGRCRISKGAAKAKANTAKIPYRTASGKTFKANYALKFKPCDRQDQVRTQRAPFKCVRRGGAAAKKLLGNMGCPDGKILIKGTRPVGGVMRAYSRCIKPKGDHKSKAAQTVCVAPKVLATKRKIGTVPARPAYTTSTGKRVAAQPARDYNAVMTRCVQKSSLRPARPGKGYSSSNPTATKYGWTAVAGAVQAPRSRGSFKAGKRVVRKRRAGPLKPCAPGKTRNATTHRCRGPAKARKAKTPRAKTATPARAKTATPARAKTPAAPRKRAASKSPKRSPAKRAKTPPARRVQPSRAAKK